MEAPDDYDPLADCGYPICCECGEQIDEVPNNRYWPTCEDCPEE